MTDIPLGTTSTITTADGRTLGIHSAGAQGGALVLHNHGGPSSRLEARLLGPAAEALGLCVVGIDRPGIGLSSPQAPRTFEGWAADMVAVADALGHERFAVTGWSEGGPWAIAAAAYVPAHRAVHVASIAGGSYGAFGANSAAQYLDAADALGGRLALHFQPGFKVMYEVLGISARDFRSQYEKALAKSACPADRQVIADPAVIGAFMGATDECFSQGADGLVADATVLYEAWPMDVTSIVRPLHIWQGTADTLVPEAINHEVAQRCPVAIWHPVQDAGHFVAVSHASDILRLAAADLGA